MSAGQAFPAACILTPGDPGWDGARRAWNLAVDQHPAAVAVPASAQGVVDAVWFARAHGLRVAAQGTGHGAAPLGSLAGTLLVKTTAMREVSIDPSARIATAGAGALWQDVVAPAAGHGLAALAGTSPDVGVAGYTVGGGISWLGRAYGLAANSVEAIEVVTADGRLVRADNRTETGLFWALRGGGGSFGVVTAIELRLFPVTEVYAGQLWWPASAASRVLRAWRELTQRDLPDEFTTAARLMNFPEIPSIPDHLRGQSFVIVFVSHLGAPRDADRLLAPLRALGPATDTIRAVPPEALGHLHMDPEGPARSLSDGLMIASLPAEAIETLARVARSEASPGVVWAELLHMGGEMKRARPAGGALAAIDADYQLSVGGPLPASPPAASVAARSVAAVRDAMRPWAARQMYLNIADAGCDPASFWSPQAYDRLRRVKAAVDPDDLIRSNHPIPPYQGPYDGSGATTAERYARGAAWPGLGF
jgi:FAD/FMN-containing dehydrogenase